MFVVVWFLIGASKPTGWCLKRCKFVNVVYVETNDINYHCTCANSLILWTLVVHIQTVQPGLCIKNDQSKDNAGDDSDA